MKIKQILFVAIFCVSAQLGSPIFGSEQRTQETGWRSWVPERFRQYVAKPFVAGAAASAGGALITIGGLAASDLNVLKAIGLLAVGSGLVNIILEIVLQNSFKTEREYTTQELVDQLAQLIEPIIADDLAYPTYSSKLHALLKRNEFFGDVLKTYQERFGENVADEIFRLACSKVSQKVIKNEEAKKRSYESIQIPGRLSYEERDKKIDEEIRKLNEEIVGMPGTILGVGDPLLGGLSGASLNAKLDRISKLLSNNPKCAAFVSVILRLKNQQLVEIQNSGTYEKTNFAKFYQPLSSHKEPSKINQRKRMTQEQWQLYRQQKKAAETGKPLLEKGG